MIIQKIFHVFGMRIGVNEFDRRIFIAAWAAARKTWKIQAWMGIQTLTSATVVQCSTTAIRPTEKSDIP